MFSEVKDVVLWFLLFLHENENTHAVINGDVSESTTTTLNSRVKDLQNLTLLAVSQRLSVLCHCRGNESSVVC